ncbi:hypothetical protein BI311_24260 (plasmid) [Xanthomonas citri pv. citri]|nr:hypothetical protein BI311_24260 [Xanthomonas citri pv. citri]
MGFLLFKVRIVYGWLLGLYDKRRRDERLAIVTRYARQPIPQGLDWTPSRKIALRHERFEWILASSVIFASVIFAITVAVHSGSSFSDIWLAPLFVIAVSMLIYQCICRFPTVRTIYRDELLDKAMLEVAQAMLFPSDERRNP